MLSQWQHRPSKFIFYFLFNSCRQKQTSHCSEQQHDAHLHEHHRDVSIESHKPGDHSNISCEEGTLFSISPQSCWSTDMSKQTTKHILLGSYEAPLSMNCTSCVNTNLISRLTKDSGFFYHTTLIALLLSLQAVTPHAALLLLLMLQVFLSHLQHRDNKCHI